jgi:hypothetical protein
MNQAIIFVTGVVALWCATGDSPKARKWAPVIGLLGQPSWAVETWGLPGMFSLSCVYTIVWLRGLHVQFFKRGEPT